VTADDRPFKPWRDLFEGRRFRPLPAPPAAVDTPADRRAALVRLLARFHAGETGEGRIVAELRRSPPPGADADFHRAIELFIAEEGRHARILGDALRAFGGRPDPDLAVKAVFTAARRLLGPQFELLVLHVAEVIGISCYRCLAEVAHEPALRTALAEIADDERGHLDFHTEFFASRVRNGLPPPAFDAAFSLVVAAALTLLLVDTGLDFRRLGVPPALLVRRVVRLSRCVPREVARRAALVTSAAAAAPSRPAVKPRRRGRVVFAP
jgi:hypothetical protein